MNYMDRIWANRLEAYDQTWASVSQDRKHSVLVVLRFDVTAGVITPAEFQSITGEKFEQGGPKNE